MSLKSDFSIDDYNERACESQIIKELSEKGIDVLDRKSSSSILNGSLMLDMSINRSAFRKVCAMLVRERNNTIKAINNYKKKVEHRNICILILSVITAITITMLLVLPISGVEQGATPQLSNASTKPTPTATTTATTIPPSIRTPPPTITPIQKVKQPIMLPSNGYIVYPNAYGYPENGSGILTIKASPSENYFIKLRDSRTDELVLSFIVHAGKSVDVNVPFGEYELTYACGDLWYGYEELFGDDTSYSRADDPFEFKDYGDSVSWWTVELYLQYDGNLDTYAIDPNKF